LLTVYSVQAGDVELTAVCETFARSRQHCIHYDCVWRCWLVHCACFRHCHHSVINTGIVVTSVRSYCPVRLRPVLCTPYCSSITER